MARELATSSGDLETAFRAVQETAARFDVDSAALKTDSAEQITKALRLADTAGAQAVAQRLLDGVEEALDSDDVALARALHKPAQVAAGKSRDDALRERAKLLLKQLVEAEKAVAEIDAAKKTLETSPEDAEAHLALGRYLCFTKEDWEAGLSHLVKGSDSQLKSLAEKELANPSEAPERAAVGDGWWELAEQSEGAWSRAYRLRAASWYRSAIGQLPADVHKDAIQKRLDAVTEQQAANRPELAAKKGRSRFEGTWVIHYGNGRGRRYEIDAEGNVHWGTRRGPLTPGKGNELVLDLGEGTVERIRGNAQADAGGTIRFE